MIEGYDRHDDQIVAIGLLTQSEVVAIGAQLSRLYPVQDVTPFADLLDAIDEADRDYHVRTNSRAD